MVEATVPSGGVVYLRASLRKRCAVGC